MEDHSQEGGQTGEVPLCCLTGTGLARKVEAVVLVIVGWLGGGGNACCGLGFMWEGLFGNPTKGRFFYSFFLGLDSLTASL